MGYSEEYHLDVQQQLGSHSVVDIGYVGNRGLHLPFSRDIDQVPQGLLGPGNTQPSRPYPLFQGINGQLFDNSSSYNSLQASFRKEFSAGNTFLVNYTFARTIDLADSSGWGGSGVLGAGSGQSFPDWQNAYAPQENRGLSTTNMTHMLNGLFVYQIPIGKGRQFLNSSALVDGFLGGWQLSSLFQFHTGTPFTLNMGSANLSSALSGAWRPNRVASGHIKNPNIGSWFDVNAFQQPAPYTFGDSGRNILTGPGWKQVDLSVAKSFGFAFKDIPLSLQLKLDAVDALNSPNFGMPNGAIGTSDAGTITTANTNRKLQIGASMTF